MRCARCQQWTAELGDCLMCRRCCPTTRGHSDHDRFASVAARIDPVQAPFWANLGGHPLTPADTGPYGVEFVADPARLTELFRRCICPTAIDVGHGVFGIRAGLLFVDDDTGRAIAYAPPELRYRERQP